MKRERCMSLMKLAGPVALAAPQACTALPQAAAPTADKPAGKASESSVGKPAQSVSPQAQAQLDSALALVKAGQHEPAVEALKKLASALPDNAIPPINLALVYKKLDKLDLAETQLK